MTFQGPLIEPLEDITGGRIDLARIEQFGQIREVTVEDIFLD